MGYSVVGAAAGFLQSASSLALCAAAPLHSMGIFWGSVDNFSTLTSTKLLLWEFSSAGRSTQSPCCYFLDWSAYYINDDPNGLLGRRGCC
ncbi:hypothetical protein JOL62DRAFT_581363 [Phyllosticta paracitricarpa]|uniref:Secreted protein n=1 Tax=Phyllosticta paracitricarpa TaxID=2016321 RepID=A0ABR1MZH1_9PEZI